MASKKTTFRPALQVEKIQSRQGAGQWVPKSVVFNQSFRMVGVPESPMAAGSN